MPSLLNRINSIFLVIVILKGVTVQPSSPTLSSSKANAIHLLLRSIAEPSSRNDSDNNQECQQTVESFTEALSGFDACALIHTIPYKICLSCSVLYQNLVDSYQTLREIWEYKSCPKSSEETFENIFGESQNIWDRGNCQDCFDVTSGRLEESNETLEFIKKITDLGQCLQSSQNACQACRDIFQRTGKFYHEIYWNHDRSICSDLNYLMSQAADLWKYKYKCENTVEPSTLLLGIISSIIVGTFLFYSCIRFTQKPADRHPILTENRFSFSVNSKGLNEHTPLLRN